MVQILNLTNDVVVKLQLGKLSDAVEVVDAYNIFVT
jgi:hypothetical protein